MLEQNFEMESWKTFFNLYNIPKKRKEGRKKKKKSTGEKSSTINSIFSSPHFS